MDEYAKASIANVIVHTLGSIVGGEAMATKFGSKEDKLTRVANICSLVVYLLAIFFSTKDDESELLYALVSVLHLLKPLIAHEYRNSTHAVLIVEFIVSSLVIVNLMYSIYHIVGNVTGNAVAEIVLIGITLLIRLATNYHTQKQGLD